MMTTIEQIELYCDQAYESNDTELRSRAEQACLSLSESVNGFETSRILLERGSSHYSQLVAISTLTKLLNKNQLDLTIEQRLEIRNMCLNYLIQRDNLADFVVRDIVSLICRITKLGWLDTGKEDNYPFREVIAPLMDMIKTGQPSPILLGVQILYSLVYEFNQSYEGDITRSTIVMRKIANNFRENQLFTIFQVSIDLLGRMSSNIKSLNLYDSVQHAIVQYSLKLTLACLSYDFIGTGSGEEVSDDLTSVQIPTNWRQSFLAPTESPDPVPLFFRLFEHLPANLGHLAVACLVQTASFRRSFFNNNERQTFLGQLINGVCDLLSINNDNGIAQLDDSNCYHELCRLLCRLKSNFQLGELVTLTTYPRFIDLLSRFTIRSLERADNDTNNSQHYLLLTWQRLVASLPYLRCTQPHLLDTHCPGVLDAYIHSRMRSVISHDANGPWGDLDDSVNIPQELESVSVLSRCQYPLTVSRLVSLFDDIASRFSSGQCSDTITPLRELCWLVLLMGACINGRIGATSTGSSDDNDRLDGELVGRVLQLASMIDTADCVAVNDNRLLQALAALEVAILAFLDQIRRVYLCGETCIRAVRLYDVLQQRIAVADDTQLLEMLVQKILVNLRSWARLSKAVLNRSLALLHELSMGAVAKRLMKLQVIQSLLEHHSPLHLSFLQANDPNDVAFAIGASHSHGQSHNNQSNNDMYRHSAVQLTSNTAGASNNARTCFYASLTRLFLLSPHAEDQSVFLEFMSPLTAACDSLTQILSTATNLSHHNEAETKLALMALIRDVRGVATACHSKNAFQAQFEWLYPVMFSHLMIGIDLWGPTEPWGLTLGCLKLVAELSLSRNNRLQPQVASPSGELMFRVCSRVLICYGEKITLERLTSIRSNKTLYLLFIKEATACIDILRNLLTGNYVNLGAFALYADDSLEKCLQIFLQLMVSVLSDDLMSYPKLARSYYCLADSLTQDHLIWLGTQGANMILYFVTTVCDGLVSTSLAVSSSSCSSLDNLISFLLRLVQTPTINHARTPRQLILASSGTVGGSNNSNGSGVRVSDNVRTSIDNFLLTSQHLSARDIESRDNWRMLVHAVPSQLMGILSRAMDTLFHALMQSECKNQWAMSRPLLALILLDNKEFMALQHSLITQRLGGTVESQQALKDAFDKLMEDVTCSLTIRNRDKFTQNLNTFRHSLSAAANSAGVSGTASVGTGANGSGAAGATKLIIDHSYNSAEMIA